MKKITATLLALVLALSMLPMQVFAASYSDVDGHWAESSIDRWSDHGVIQGNKGKFQPNDGLTCAHLAAILSRLLALPEAESAGFLDVNEDDWFADALDRCAAAGIILGHDGYANPNGTIPRERAMVILARALGIEPLEDADLSDYRDDGSVSDYARGYMAALIAAGVIQGNDGSLQPFSDITRAATAAILDRAISVYADQDGATVESDGTGIVLVTGDNVTVTGEVDTLVVAGGSGSVNVSGAKVGQIIVTGPKSTVTVSGSDVSSITVTGDDVTVETDDGASVKEVNVNEGTSGVTVDAGKGTTIGSVTNAGKNTTVTGSGKVKEVETATDVTVETRGTEVSNSGDNKINVTDQSGKDTTVSSGDSSFTAGSTAPKHHHSYDETTLRCVCGDFRSDVVATVNNESGYTDLAAAFAAAKSGDHVVLIKDETLDATKATADDRLTITKPITLTLRAKLIAPGELEPTDNFAALFIKADTTINADENGGIVCRYNQTKGDCGPYGIFINNSDADVTINGGFYHGGGTAIQVTMGNLTIQDGQFEVDPYAEAKYGYKFLLNCLDKNYKAGTAKIVVKGGSFKNYDPSDSASENPYGNFVASGYKATRSGDVWTVSALTATDDAVAQVGNMYYATLKDAFDSIGANQTGTIKLLKDATVNEKQKIADGQTLTIDLNGNDITFATQKTSFEVSHGTLNLTGSGTVKEDNPYFAPVTVFGSTDSSAEGYSVVNVGKDVTLQGWSGLMIRQYDRFDTTSNSTAAYGIQITVNGTLKDAYDGESYGGSIYVNGNIKNTTGNVPEITLTSSGKIYSEDYAIFAAGYAKWNLAGTIVGKGGIEAKSGEFNITGGSITATAESTAHTRDDSGTSTTGYALVAVNNKGYAGHPAVTVTGGTFTGVVAIVDDDQDTTNNTATLSITGGTFSVDPTAYLATGYKATKDESKNVWTVSANNG